MTKQISRRTVLRGMLGGAAVSVGLPLLDCFLNGNGTALAQGAPLPVRFGTWFWGCGMNPDRWVPSDGGRRLRPAAGARGAGGGDASTSAC